MSHVQFLLDADQNRRNRHRQNLSCRVNDLSHQDFTGILPSPFCIQPSVFPLCLLFPGFPPMNSLQRLSQQFVEIWNSLNRAQRVTLVLAPMLLVAAFATLVWNRSGSQMTALSWGRVYSTEELIAAEQALIEAGLTEFRREGQRIMVPEAEKDRYNAALLSFDALPADLGSQMLKQYESLSPFISEKQRQEMKEAMLLQELRRTLRAVPELEDARVVVANPYRRNAWSQRGRTTANVTVRPKAGRELSPRLVNSLRSAVAGMVPDLKPADVTIFDQVNGVSFTGDEANDPFDSKLVNRIRELTRQYETQISRDLGYIPHVGVTVHVDIENLKSSVIRTQQIDPKKIAAVVSNEHSITDMQTQRPARGEPGQVANRPGSVVGGGVPDRNRQLSETDNRVVNGVSFEVAEKELLAAMPKAVQVSVNIPRDYYRDIVAQRTAGGEKDPALLDVTAVEKEVLAAVSRSVSRLIPAGSPPEAITVNTVDRLSVETPEPTIPMTETLFEFAKTYGGSILLGVLAVWIVLTLRKTAGSTAAISAATPSASALEQLQTAANRQTEDEETVTIERPKSRREMLQSIVRENPDATAAVIGRWVQAAK